MPACTPCIKAGYTCPGTKSEFDSNLRDQTALVQEREQRRAQTRQARGPFSGTSPPLARRSQADSSAKFGSAADVSGSRSPRDSLEQRATFNLFSIYVLVPRHPETQSTFISGLSSIHLDRETESLLTLATNAIAFGIQGADRSQPQKKRLGQRYYSEALAISHETLQDPSTCDSDETLMAMLLLGFYEVSLFLLLLNCEIGAIPCLAHSNPSLEDKDRDLSITVPLRYVLGA